MNIYAKLTFLCLFLVIFTAGVLSFFADRQVEKTLRDEIVANTSQQTQNVSEDIGRFISAKLEDVLNASNSTFFKNQVDNNEALTRTLRQLESLNESYYSFSYYDMKRMKIADSRGLELGSRHANSLYWQQLNAGAKIAMDISGDQSNAMMRFAARVEDIYNESKGVLVAQIPLEELYEIVNEYTPSADNTRKTAIHLIDEEGTMLYSSGEEDTYGVDEVYPDYTLLSDLEDPGVNFLETDEMLYFVTNDISYEGFSGNDWKLVLSIPREMAFMPLASVRKRILWAVLPVVFVSILFSLYAANLFVKPIVGLSRAAEELRKGNLDAKLPIGNDEIGRLAKQLAATSKSLARQLREQRSSNKKLHEQKSQIEIQKNQLEFISSQIRDSISYAERIQRSTLPPISSLQNIFPESFVMYKPKDIIGGDFYWFERVRKGNNEFMIIACGDCTGHGVPGAIMSIMGSNQLTNIVYYQNYIDPRKIISRLDKVIKFELQNESLEASRDGMEISICVIDLDTLRLEFSGVGIPLRILKQGSNKLDIYKTPRQMVGGMEGDEQQVHAMMKKEVVQLEPKDRIFLSSDGFQDQFGGPNDKKFLSRNFNKLLEESSKNTIQDQWRILERSFTDWSKNTSQTDDVCVLGFEVK